MSKKKKNTKKEGRKSQKKRTSNDFFKANWNDEVYIRRTIAKKGGVSGRRLG